ncbi:MoaD/ThiS family protein [Rhizobium sp. L1K21]|uniref:MoaD/ThiS family protein n=1 Tax=Rhizobium sp. L1K21 TaxID=2954933 RepID=UPI00209256D4|nr:MoaD/ThiS family protein [Rhizobium sp. L1K21]MCO6187666.1 MoaD/ThiS family protein [Rhizobium sp. L1K21]
MPVIDVNLWSSLRRFAGGEEIVSVEAETVAGMINALKKAYPDLAPALDAGVSVSVNGEITNNRFAPLEEGSEVFLLQPLKGG